MATSTTTTATTPTTFALCAAESDAAPAVFDFAALYRAWQACRRGKRGTRNAQRYELTLLDNLFDTAQALQTHAWRPSRPLCLVTTYPKPREILAASFGDRVVHHALVPWFERLYEPVLIHDSHANRKGHGTHAAVRRLQRFLRANRGGFYLQLDVTNFFNSINRRVLFGLLRERVRRDMRRPSHGPRHVSVADAEHMLWLARVLLTGNPAHAAVFQGRPTDLARVPPHKRLGNAPPETGIPIGNLTSQFFANVYLNELDQFIKHELKVRHYLRYVDDFVLVHPDASRLAAWCDAIRAECELGPAWARQSWRPGLPVTVSVPMARIGQVQRALTRAGTPWCMVHENGRLHRRLKRRQLTAIWPALPVNPDHPKPRARATVARQTTGDPQP